MWQALRNEYASSGFELVTVGMDSLGAAGCRAFIEAAAPEHPSLIDAQHQVAHLFGVINIPSSVWIDESFNVVRPAEPAPAPPREQPRASAAPADIPERLRQMGAEAAKIRNDAESYHAALRDWVAQGAASRFAMAPATVVERSRPRDADRALGHAHFELGAHCEALGDHDGAIEHFRHAHRLVPESWTFRRQAWSLESAPELGPFARFWQGPSAADPESWPYAGDWLSDIQAEGAENYNAPFEA